jgi:H+-transporting ATPase
MTEAAMILSALGRHWPDFLLANAGVGFREERESGNAISP